MFEKEVLRSSEDVRGGCRQLNNEEIRNFAGLPFAFRQGYEEMKYIYTIS
jgi:hypothetical protein